MADLLTTKELRTKSLEQLQALLSERREKLRHLRFQVSSREVKNNQELKFSRKEIARILTIINDLRKQP